MSLRLRFLRPGESFQFICTADQVEKMKRVAGHNGGAADIVRLEEGAVFMRVTKLARQEP